MKTGIELIAQERQEQIEKHGRTVDDDAILNDHNQLSYGAVLLLKKDSHSLQRNKRPIGWDKDIWNKMYDKPRKERLIIAGALIAAEIDRLQVVEFLTPQSGEKTESK